ncbi:unnamed protein product [Ceutorhynchus assimilis]|uniref:Uncharacterized protein n=1 Tax=Ceutorhynchus assimilis TaxID=467358 RepID=A0A9N9MJ90_9CUCU|nr:unnamed protein product [Ceutorhynchus assimilis]
MDFFFFFFSASNVSNFVASHFENLNKFVRTRDSNKNFL